MMTEFSLRIAYIFVASWTAMESQLVTIPTAQVLNSTKETKVQQSAILCMDLTKGLYSKRLIRVPKLNWVLIDTMRWKEKVDGVGIDLSCYSCH
jgi:hypothetical protein